jgi:hypothetical protein
MACKWQGQNISTLKTCPSNYAAINCQLTKWVKAKAERRENNKYFPTVWSQNVNLHQIFQWSHNYSELLHAVHTWNLSSVMLWFRCNRDIINPRWNNCTSKENNAVIWIHSLKDTFKKWGKGSVSVKVIKPTKLGICRQGQVHDPQQDPWCHNNGLSIYNVVPLTTGKKAPDDRTHLASARNRY